MLNKGTIVLQRKNFAITAGFAILTQELVHLLKQTHVLHQEEFLYFNSLKYEKRKFHYLLGRICAKHAIHQIIPSNLSAIQLHSFAIGSGVFQFPIIKHLPYSGFQVSISHCDTTGIAMAYPEEHPMGVDIEKIDFKKMDTIINILTKKEIALTNLYFSDKTIAFTLLWTVKESLSKILKTGLTIDFKFLEIDSLTYKNGIYIVTYKNLIQYKSLSIVLDSYIISVSCPKNTEISLKDFSNDLTFLNSINI